MKKCSGSESIPSSPGAVTEISCPKCGYEIEFFSDDAKRKCKKCGQVIENPQYQQPAVAASKE